MFGAVAAMLMTTWLGLFRSPSADFDRTVERKRRGGRRDPWRNAETAFRSNPFRPPMPERAIRGSRLRPSELRWMVKQRQF